MQGDLSASDADVAILTESLEDLSRVNDWVKRTPFENRRGGHRSAQMTLLQRKLLTKLCSMYVPLTNPRAAIERDDILDLDQQLRRSHSDSDGHSGQQFLLPCSTSRLRRDHNAVLRDYFRMLGVFEISAIKFIGSKAR